METRNQEPIKGIPEKWNKPLVCWSEPGPKDLEKSLKSSIRSKESKNDNPDKGMEGETAQQKYHEGAIRVLKSFVQSYKPWGQLSSLCSSLANGTN